MGGRSALAAWLTSFSILLVLTPATALHWDVDVSFGPTSVPMESTQTFTVTLRNNGPDPVAVHRVEVTFDWVASGFVYLVTDQVFNLAPANERSFTLSVDIPRLVQDSVHTTTITVTAETSGDLFEEEREYQGQVTVIAAAADASTVLLVGIGLLMVVAIAVGLVMYARSRKKAGAPASPPSGPASVQATSACPNCGKPLTYVTQYQRWYCQAESRYV